MDYSRINGTWEYMLQWDSMCRTPTWYNNKWEAGEGSYEVGDIQLSNKKKVHESTAPIAIKWSSRFMLGKKLRMGVVRNQDKALTVDHVLFIWNISKKYWIKLNSEEEKKELE